MLKGLPLRHIVGGVVVRSLHVSTGKPVKSTGMMQNGDFNEQN